MHQTPGAVRGVGSVIVESDTGLKNHFSDFLSTLLLDCLYNLPPPTPHPHKKGHTSNPTKIIDVCSTDLFPQGDVVKHKDGETHPGKWQKEIRYIWSGLSSLHMSAGELLWGDKHFLNVVSFEEQLRGQ